MELFVLAIVLLLFSFISYLVAHISTIKYFLQLGSWSTPPGKYATALEQTGNIVLVNISKVMCAAAMILIIVYYVIKWKKGKSDGAVLTRKDIDKNLNDD
jgi:hypothetical protein